MTRPPRNPVPDEALWPRVARTVTPLKKGSAKPDPKALPDKEAFADMMRVPPRQDTKKPVSAGPVDENRARKVRRGKVEIDAKIDLHDMTRDSAFSALRHTLIRAYNRNHRCILVVTGKGKRLEGVLRQSFPEWINHPDLRSLISGYAQAHQRHGGSGAWYVFLRGSGS